MNCMKTNRNGHDYYFTSWMDNKPVHLLHTYPTFKKPVTRNSSDANGRYQAINLPQPTIIGDYNKGMGGTDLIDQRCSYYRFDHRTTKWPHRLLFHFNSVAVVNSYILWKESKPLECKDVTQKQFMIDLMKELAEYVDEVEVQAETGLPLREQVPDLRRRSNTWVNDQSRLDGSHTPSKKVARDARGICRACRIGRTATYCVECKTFLHIDGEGSQNCFWRFHNEISL